MKDVCAQFGHAEHEYQTLAGMIFTPLRYEVISRDACISWVVMRVREKSLTVIFVFTIANLRGNDFQTIVVWGGEF
jgi:hypothetical protein